MPNHFHLLLQQLEDSGISKFCGNLANSYTRYFNVKNKRKGPLFQGKFKAVRIETDEQLLHVTRYIHLNPYTSYVVKTLEELATYPYSSLPEYLKFNPPSRNSLPIKSGLDAELISASAKSDLASADFRSDEVQSKIPRPLSRGSFKKEETVAKEQVLSHFKTLKSFKSFTFNQADYQRKLEHIKHLTFEN